MTHDYRPQSGSSTSQPRSRMSTVFTLGHSSPHSSVQEWLQQVTPGAPPPTPTVFTSQAVSELPMGATASALAPQRSRSSRHSHSHGTLCSRHSSRLSVAMEVLDFTSKVTDNLLRVAESFRIDAANREEAQKHEALAREQCHHQQVERRENALKQEAIEREHRQSREALVREQNLAQDAAQREPKFAERCGSPRGKTPKRGSSPEIKCICTRRIFFANSCGGRATKFDMGKGLH